MASVEKINKLNNASLTGLVEADSRVPSIVRDVSQNSVLICIIGNVAPCFWSLCSSAFNYSISNQFTNCDRAIHFLAH